ncbi:MAG: hypothetical protein OXC12_19300 [Spirochaetaceae bacterium]|nr:hypothetical protein [Spirochaetaceae bacterium]
MSVVQPWRFDVRGMAVALGELSGRILWYSFLHLVLLSVLYLLGNVQGFLDQTQLLLLRLMEVAGIAAGGSGVYRVGYCLIRAFTAGTMGMLQLAATALATALAIALLLASIFLLIWFQL